MNYKYMVSVPGLGVTYCNNGIELDQAIRFALERSKSTIIIEYIGPAGSDLPMHHVTFPTTESK